MPNVIIVCGLNGVGKSTLAKAIAKEIDYQFIDIEDIYFPKERLEEKYSNSRSFEEFKTAVISFAKQVEDFYKANSPRKYENDFDRECFATFITEWHSLYNKSNELEDCIPEIVPITFEDYDIYSEDSITDISECGIALNPFGFINFEKILFVVNGKFPIF